MDGPWDIDPDEEEAMIAEQAEHDAAAADAAAAEYEANEKKRPAPKTFTRSDDETPVEGVEEATSKCFRCGGIGHWARDCPKKAKTEPAANAVPAEPPSCVIPVTSTPVALARLCSVVERCARSDGGAASGSSMAWPSNFWPLTPLAQSSLVYWVPSG